MAAHVVGQHSPSLHLDSHRRMLGLARETRDWPEAAGQLLRLLLLPLGHLLDRIPLLIDIATLEAQLERLQHQPA